jgi:CHAT domain-containing protein
LFLNNLAVIYTYLGQYEAAESLFLKSLEIRKKQNSDYDADYMADLQNLATLNSELGKFKQAVAFYNQILEICNSDIEKYEIVYAQCLKNFALLYEDMGEYNQTELMLKQVVDIYERRYGVNHPKYAGVLGALGHLYEIIGLYVQAEPLLRKELEIYEIAFGENHPRYARGLNNLGQLYQKMKLYDKAEPLFKQALGIDKNQLGEYHPDYAIDLHSLATFYLNLGLFDKAEPLLLEANSNLLCQIETNFNFMSENEKHHFFNVKINYFNIYSSFILKYKQKKPLITEYFYNNELALKGAQLNSSLLMRQAILESDDSTLVKIFNQWTSVKQQIIFLETKSIVNRYADIDMLIANAENLEKHLTRTSQTYGNMKASFKIKWIDIKKHLRCKEAAIEFGSFHYYEGKESTDSILYCAIVLKYDDNIPKMVYLCEESQLKKAIPSSQGNFFKEINSTYSEQFLYNLIWKPLDSLLSGIETINFAPTGLLNSVALAAVTCPDGKTLMEKYNLVQLSSTRTLAMPDETEAIKDAVVYGGIKYDTDTLSMHTKAKKYHEKEDELVAYNRAATCNNRSGFRYLEGTQKEAEQITAKLDKKSISTTTYSGEDAPEESFVALSGNDSPSVIHISTHGFYYPDTISDENRKKIDLSGAGEVRFRYSDDPLLRSGLLMSGANRAWKGLPIPAGVEDGILTAKEVSNMNLMNTELVVLSACQTGQGDVKGSEGVEGLQRGFKMAGVRYIMMSLWEIPDRETTEFMDTFYDNWLGGQEIHDAFSNTQLKMKNKYRDEPYKWAAFVLME